MSTIEFNGITKPYLKIERSWTLPAWAPIERDYMTIPGKAGAIQTEMRTGVRKFSLPVIVFSHNFIDKKGFVEEMAEWLIHEETKSLVFSKYPHRTLYAHVEGSPDFEQMWEIGEGSIDFVCPDPYEYGRTNVDNFENGIVTLRNTGTVETPPVYEIDVLQDITHLDIISDAAYIRLGEPAPMDAPLYKQQSEIITDSMTTTNGWSEASSVDNGYVTGTMTATQVGFTATSFGSELSPRKWQGPSLRRPLPEPIQNFQMMATVELLNVGKGTGMIEIYCLDALGNTVAKVGIEDVLQSVAEVQAKFQLGNASGRKVEHYRTADYKPAWNNYKGVLRLFRSGNRFRPYFAIVEPDGRRNWVSSGYLYTDVAGEYSAPITQIQVAIRKWPTTAEASMKVRDLRVWRLNEPVEGVPYMALAGDKIIIDTKEGVVLLNGEPRNDLKDFFSDFFDLPPGETRLLMEPQEKVSGKVIVQERFK